MFPRTPLSPAASYYRLKRPILRAAVALGSPFEFIFAAFSPRPESSFSQTRGAHILASLRDNKGAHQKRIRVGRGPSSGKGKTSGRGHKGQGQHGKVKPWFQGGQTPLVVSKGLKGFINHRAPELALVNLDRLQNWIDFGRIDPTKLITPREIFESRCASLKKFDGIKLCHHSFRAPASITAQPIRQPIDILVSHASATAIAAIEAAGGRIVTRYFTRQSLRRLVKGKSVVTDVPLPVGKVHMDSMLIKARQGKFKYRLPDPTSRWDMEYYRDPAHRGYLSHLIKPGESPSLYFKVPGPKKIVYKRESKEDEEEEEKVRLWTNLQ